MNRRARSFASVFVVAAVSTLAVPQSTAAQTQSPADRLLTSRVEAALRAASDVPADSITVGVSAGVVTLTGSVICADCGGSRTPSGSGAVQQSLGAVVRAVPGVERVLFELVYRRE